MILDLKTASKTFEDKLKKIKLCIFDVDGIITDGTVYYESDEMGFNRWFNVRDGYGMKILNAHGIPAGFISGGKSKGLEERVSQLGLPFAYLGNEDKRTAFNELMQKYNVDAEEILYMGDELFDLPLLRKAGFSATVECASHEVHDVCDYICQTPPGKGCVREVIDMLRYAQNIHPEIPDFE